MRGNGRGHIERRPSGSFRAIWYAPDGARQAKSFSDMGDAEDWLAERRIEVKRGLWQPPRPAVPTLTDYASEWIPQRRNRHGRPLAPRTVELYERIIARDLGDLAAMALDAITPADVRRWYVTLDAHPASQSNAYGLLRAVFHTAVEDELVDRTPCRIRGGTSKDRATTTTVLTPDEVDMLASHMPARYRALVYVAAYAGLRQGEEFELRRRGVDPDGLLVSVELAVTFTKGQVHVRDPKSRAGIRPVAVPPHVAGVLAEHLRIWVDPHPDALVFTSGRGNRMRASTLYRSFYPAREAIGRPDLRWHDLRHTGATLAAQAGATLAELQARLGHSTVAAAMIYQHATSERDREIAARISERATTGPRLRVVP